MTEKYRNYHVNVNAPKKEKLNVLIVLYGKHNHIRSQTKECTMCAHTYTYKNLSTPITDLEQM